MVILASVNYILFLPIAMYNRIALLTTLLISTAALNGKSQITSVVPPETPDAAVKMLYHSITYDGETMPDWTLFRQLFIEEAILIHATDTTYYKLDVDTFIDNFKQQIKSGNMLTFRERELHRRSESFGSIYHAFSTYTATLETPDVTDTFRGINSIQLLQKDGSWYISSILWFDENSNQPLPDEYLPVNNR